MPISFNNIPANFRVPLYYVEVDSSKAGLPINRLPTVLVGHMNNTALVGVPPAANVEVGTALPNVPIPIASQAMADDAFGQGSMLACMFETYFKNNWAQEVWGLPMAEPAGVAATKTLTVTAAATIAGTYHLYIAGRHCPVTVLVGDTTAVIAASIAAAVNTMQSLPVSATAATNVCTLLAKAKGTWGNDISVIANYYGATGGDIMPPGLAVTIATGVTGTGDPTFGTAITNLGESPAEYVCQPFNDSNSLLAWKTEFGFSDTGRWGWVRQLYGHLFGAKKETMGNLLTFVAQAGNNPQLSIMALELLSPTPAYEWAAAYTAKAARGLSIDPARPLQSLHLEGVLPAQGLNRFLLSQLNTFSLAGLATQRTFADGIPVITRETTTYTLNNFGNTDDAYTDVTTLATLAKLLRNQRQAITSKYPRHKLANDGTRFGVGQAIVTPKTIKAELVAQYRQDEFVGLVEDAQNFKANLIVERDPNDPNRINVLYPPDLVNQLRIFAVLAQFRLQFNRGVDLAIV